VTCLSFVSSQHRLKCSWTFDPQNVAAGLHFKFENEVPRCSETNIFKRKRELEKDRERGFCQTTPSLLPQDIQKAETRSTALQNMEGDQQKELKNNNYFARLVRNWT